MKKKLCCTALILLLVVGGTVVAQVDPAGDKPVDKKMENSGDNGDEKSKDDKKIIEAIKDIYRRLDIGVKIFIDWYSAWGYDNAAYDRITVGTNRWRNGLGTALADVNPKNNNTFRISRAYLDLKYRFNDYLSARLTSDVDASVTPVGASNAAFHLYLKYAYLEVKKDFGPVMLSATGGMIQTPIYGYIDKLSDFRWVAEHYVENSRPILNNQKIDNGTDLGLKASIGIMKWVTLTGAVTNGEGYKSLETDSNKAVYGLVAINPAPVKQLKDLHLFGFARYEITSTYDWTGKKAKRQYFGYGIVYSGDLIKVGLNHIFPYVRTVGAASYFNSAYKFGTQDLFVYPQQWRSSMIVELFLNFNLGAVVPTVPLIITGRYGHGIQYGTKQKLLTDPEFGKGRKTDAYSVGIGWRFNKNFRILVGGEIQKFFVKKNSALRGLESTPGGTDYYNASALGLGILPVGSRNPHDAQRLYVKAEVVF